MTHTPAPWRATSAPYDDGTPYFRVEAGDPFTDNETKGFDIHAIMRADDAHLIAAAPELLAALRMFIAAEDDWNERDGSFDDPLTDAYHAAKVAVAKAEAE